MTEFTFLNAKTIFVIGGASGLGAKVATFALDRGARVVVFDVLPSGIGEYRHVDLRDKNSIEKVTDETNERFDILIASAGLSPGADPASILLVNYLGQIRFINGLLSNAMNDAKVISIASIGGREWKRYGKQITELQSKSDTSDVSAYCRDHGIDGKAAYRLSKAALIQWTRQMTVAYPENDVSFMTVSPGPVNTELFKQAAKKSPGATADLRAAAPGVVEPDEVAKAVLGLCRSEFRWLNGINIPLDGGADARFDALGLNMNINFEGKCEEH